MDTAVGAGATVGPVAAVAAGVGATTPPAEVGVGGSAVVVSATTERADGVTVAGIGVQATNNTRHNHAGSCRFMSSRLCWAGPQQLKIRILTDFQNR